MDYTDLKLAIYESEASGNITIEESNDILDRIKIIERYLYGKAVEDTSDTLTGLNSAIDVGTETLRLNKKKIIQLTENIKIDVANNTILFNDIALVANNKGHFTIK